MDLLSVCTGDNFNRYVDFVASLLLSLRSKTALKSSYQLSLKCPVAAGSARVRPRPQLCWSCRCAPNRFEILYQLSLTCPVAAASARGRPRPRCTTLSLRSTPL